MYIPSFFRRTQQQVKPNGPRIYLVIEDIFCGESAKDDSETKNPPEVKVASTSKEK